MKKLLFILFGVLIVTGCSTGRNASDTGRSRNYTAKQLQTMAEVDSMIRATNFQFVPYELQTRLDGNVRLNGYQSAKILPERLLVEMTGTRVEGFFLGDTAYDKAVIRGNKWYITMTLDYQTGKMTFEFEIDRPSASATLKVSTNRDFEVKTYRGYIVPN